MSQEESGSMSDSNSDESLGVGGDMSSTNSSQSAGSQSDKSQGSSSSQTSLSLSQPTNTDALEEITLSGNNQEQDKPCAETVAKNVQVQEVVRYRSLLASSQDFRKRAIQSKLSGRFQDIKQYTRYYFHKSLSLLKQAHKSLDKIDKNAANSQVLSDEQAKVSLQMGNTLLHVSCVQFESEFRGKFISRALKHFEKAMTLSPQKYRHQVMRLQGELIEFIRVKIQIRVDDPEVLQAIFEQLEAHVPQSMSLLWEYCQNQLFQLYFKLANEVESTTADRKA